MNQENNKPTKISLVMSSKPSRPDLMEANFYRHLNECKSIITFLGSFTDYEVVRKELNDHITNLINNSENEY